MGENWRHQSTSASSGSLLRSRAENRHDMPACTSRGRRRSRRNQSRRACRSANGQAHSFDRVEHRWRRLTTHPDSPAHKRWNCTCSFHSLRSYKPLCFRMRDGDLGRDPCPASDPCPDLDHDDDRNGASEVRDIQILQLLQIIGAVHPGGTSSRIVRSLPVFQGVVRMAHPALGSIMEMIRFPGI